MFLWQWKWKKMDFLRCFFVVPFLLWERPDELSFYFSPKNNKQTKREGFRGCKICTAETRKVGHIRKKEDFTPPCLCAIVRVCPWSEGRFPPPSSSLSRSCWCCGGRGGGMHTRSIRRWKEDIPPPIAAYSTHRSPGFEQKTQKKRATKTLPYLQRFS